MLAEDGGRFRYLSAVADRVLAGNHMRTVLERPVIDHAVVWRGRETTPALKQSSGNGALTGDNSTYARVFDSIRVL